MLYFYFAPAAYHTGVTRCVTGGSGSQRDVTRGNNNTGHQSALEMGAVCRAAVSTGTSLIVLKSATKMSFNSTKRSLALQNIRKV